jgi:predicted nicotinamide N-methyase
MTHSQPIEIAVTPSIRIQLLQHKSSDAVLEAAIRDAATDPYAHLIWPASLAAARALARVPRTGQVILDVGAGTGLGALTAAALGARAIAIDRDAAALARITDAARMNGVTVQCMQLDITSETPLPLCDAAVFADLLYETDLARAVANRVLEVLATGATAIVADPGRMGGPLFDEMMVENDVSITWAEMTVQLPGDSPESVQVAILS